MPDHVHMLIAIPKYSVAQIIGYMMGRSECRTQDTEFSGPQIPRASVGRDDEAIRAYIRNQELADRQLEQFELKISAAQNLINRPNIP
jgi:putative transposase